MQKIIITADDYGMCDAVDKAIDAGIENGIITTTNVLLNMDSLHNARTLRKRYPQISIGIHWNVTTGKPVCNPNNIQSLVDEKGEFWNINEFKRRYGKHLILKEDLIKELEAQYNLFESICGKPDYWNTHENCALHIKAFYIFAKIAKNHGINATRTFQRVYYDKVGIGVKGELREFAVRNFFEIWFSLIRREFRMPVARVVSFDKISKLEGDYLLNALLKDGRDNIEVVFHPALIAEYPYFGNFSQKRVQEYQFVSSASVKDRYESKGIHFVNFDEI
jgi:predicted glycoside hydrolase/deacetylase ChbG (UPF0249 family)